MENTVRSADRAQAIRKPHPLRAGFWLLSRPSWFDPLGRTSQVPIAASKVLPSTPARIRRTVASSGALVQPVSGCGRIPSATNTAGGASAAHSSPETSPRPAPHTPPRPGRWTVDAVTRDGHEDQAGPPDEPTGSRPVRAGSHQHGPGTRRCGTQEKMGAQARSSITIIGFDTQMITEAVPAPSGPLHPARLNQDSPIGTFHYLPRPWGDLPPTRRSSGLSFLHRFPASAARRPLEARTCCSKRLCRCSYAVAYGPPLGHMQNVFYLVVPGNGRLLIRLVV